MSTGRDGRTEVQRAVALHWATRFSRTDPPSRDGNRVRPGQEPLTKQDPIPASDGPNGRESAEIELEATSDESGSDIEILEEREIKKSRHNPPHLPKQEILASPVFVSSKLQIPSPVHVFDTPVLRPPESDSILSIFSSKLLQETYVFSFELDVEFIMSSMHDKMGTKVHIIAQNLYNERKVANIEYIGVQDVITNWSCHHSKMVINFYKDDTMQVFISTSNFTPDEYAVLGGVYWKSELLLPVSDDPKQQFKIDLCSYLEQYKKKKMDRLINMIKWYDFSAVKASFVGSTPGVSSGLFGYLKLRHHLAARNLFPKISPEKKFKFLAQVSTIAGPFKSKKDETSNIFTHLLSPLVMNEEFPLLAGESGLKDLKVEPMIVFPTIRELVESKGGVRGGGCLIYNNISKKGVLQDSYLSEFFFKRNPDEGNFVNNHSKIYLFTEDDFATLNWCFIGSMNLSKSAWGEPLAKDNSKLRGNNWECGVLLDPKDYTESGKFVPTFEENVHYGENVPIRLPFKLPVTRYTFQDQVWCKFNPIFFEN